jgi:hypothetical protein
MPASIWSDKGPVTAGCCEHADVETWPVKQMYKRITFVGPYPYADCTLNPCEPNHISASPYGAPSLVEIVAGLGENALVSDNAAVVAVIVAEAFAVPPDPVQAIE